MPWKRLSKSLIVLICTCAMLIGIAGCRARGGYDAVNKADCLPDVQMTDQNGKTMSLASLKGKYNVIDFIYTSCPGPCLTLTSRMTNIARHLDPRVATNINMVSITIDPEHDTPAQLLAYSHAQGADKNGQIFLTSSPEAIEKILSAFNMRRERETDGSITHVIGIFLVGPDGRELKEYGGDTLTSEAVLADLQNIIKPG